MEQSQQQKQENKFLIMFKVIKKDAGQTLSLF